MISADMRLYDCFTLGGVDAYGQPLVNLKPTKQVKMCVNTISQSVTNSIAYQNSSYIGLTLDKELSESDIILYGNKKLKVLYVQPKGRYRQVFLGDYE